MTPTCPSCYSPDVRLDDVVPAEDDDLLVHLDIWCCGTCHRKWATN